MLNDTQKTRGFHVGLRFAPAAVFDKAHRQQFQNKLSQGFDWTRQEFQDKVWILASPQAEGDPRSHSKLTLQPDVMNFEEIFPVSPFDVFLDSLRLAMEGLSEVFSPRLLLGSGAMMRLTLAAPGGDARIFLGNRCLNLQDRLAPLNRSIHAVGVKMVLPPIDLANQPSWQGEIKIESLVEDVRQIFVELDAKWAAPTAWSPDSVVERARTAHAFITNEIIRFLEQYESP